ncbi:heme-binding domain-containing protein [Wenyingzhuangia sp. IMCC45533]
MIKKIVLVLLAIFIVIQFVDSNKNNAAVRELENFTSETRPNEHISSILNSKCYDCHSNKTNYPWYAKIAPLSFWLDHHVEEGREHLDFSNWANYDNKRKRHKLDEVIEEVEEGEMPLTSYKTLHGDLGESEREALITWAQKAMRNY